MVTLDEQQKIQQALADVLALTDARGFIAATFAPRHQDMLLQMPNTLTVAAQHAEYILSYCLDCRWPAPPNASLLEVLLAALVNGGAADLAPLRHRISLGPDADPNRDAVNALWVRDTLPFFSRATLRPIVNKLLASDAQPILRVLGPADSGKSYTKELIEHVCSVSRPDVQVVPAEIPEGAGPSYGPADLADTLVTPTTKDVSTRPARSTSSYPAALCRWVLNAAIQSPGRWIYVLDGFNQIDVQAETRELVHALAAQIAGAALYRKRIRLVLIDYARSLPRVHFGTVLDETVPEVSQLTAAEIAACLAAHYEDLAAMQGKPKPLLSELHTVAERLLAQAVQKPEPLNVLNEQLTRLRLRDLGMAAPPVLPGP